MLLKGKFEKAYQIFQKALLIENNFQNIYNLALVLITKEEYQEAEAYLKKLDDNFYDNEIFVLTLCKVFLMQRKWTEAKQTLDNFQKKFTGSRALKNLSLTVGDGVKREKYVRGHELNIEAKKETDKKNLEKALELYHEALELIPDDGYIANNLGSVMLLMGKKPEEAAKYFEMACKIEPQNRKFQQNLYYVKVRIKKRR